MNAPKPAITSWHAYRIDATTAEVVMLGTGFGSVVGSVKLNIQGEGVITAVVKRWSDTAIVVAAPVDETVQRAHVYTIDSRGKEKQSAQSPAGESRNTNGAAPAWAVAVIDDSVDYITVDGTGLDDVVDVVLYDGSVPVQLFEASFILDGGDLLIDWPAAFAAPIKKLRLSDAGGNHVSEIDGGPAGLTPDPNGVILDVSVQQNGQYAILNLIGSGFGSVGGGVRLAKTGGQLLPADVLSNGWSDSVVQVVVDPGSSYDQIELKRADGEIATVDSGIAFPISITAVQEFAASYDCVTDEITFTSVSGLFDQVYQVDAVNYATVEAGAGYGWANIVVDNASQLRITGADVATVGQTVIEVSFYNNAGFVGTWTGSLGPITAC
jgi:hypothetical protein